MDPKPNQLSGMQQPVPNQLSAPVPATPPEFAPPPGEADGPAWQVPAPAPPKPRSRLRWLVSSLAGRLLIIGVIVAGGFLLRNYLTGSVGDLQVGDCFDAPAGTHAISDVKHHPCNEAHGEEVVFVGDYPTPADGAYPSLDDFKNYLEGPCLAAFASYTGSAFEDAEALDMGFYYPGQESWKSRDRELICYLTRIDGQPMTQSFHDAKP